MAILFYQDRSKDLCKHCLQLIDDPEYRYPLYQKEHPEIKIGPYCPKCMNVLRVCDSCHHAFLKDNMLELEGGNWKCEKCL